MPDQSLFDEYAAHIVEFDQIRGLDTRATLLAIGAAETGLDNLAIGRNDQNGTPGESYIKVQGEILYDPLTGDPIDTFYSLGYGWLQHDSGWLRADQILNGVAWTVEAIRSDPKYNLDLIIRRPGFVLYQGKNKTYIDFRKWNVFPKKSDQFMDQAYLALEKMDVVEV